MILPASTMAFRFGWAAKYKYESQLDKHQRLKDETWVGQETVF